MNCFLVVTWCKESEDEGERDADRLFLRFQHFQSMDEEVELEFFNSYNL
jgi:hypothetical protein